MKVKKLSNKEKIEILLGKVVLLLIESAIVIGAILGFFYILGLIEQIIENHFWLMIPLGIIDFILLIKMVNE